MSQSFELQSNIRQQVMDTLQLMASKDEQLEYQARVPIAQVSAELFCQWEDSFHPERLETYDGIFSTKELEVLMRFDKMVTAISSRCHEPLPDIHQFIQTDDWKQLAQAAAMTLKEFKASGN